MPENSYQDIKQFIFNKLNKAGSPLPKTKISEEIKNLQLLIAKLDADMLKNILSSSDFTNPSIDDWERMAREFEIHFDVEMKHGSLIQGDEQQARDNSWWTTIFKQKTDNYYWERYKTYLLKSLPPDVVKTIDIDTDLVMNNLGNPTEESFSRYGMVVGHVQSGKTGNYSSLICKAADAGYKFIVVIAGGINNLRDQTQERLNESFIGETKGKQVGAGIGNTRKESMPYSLTTIERDFNKQDADRLAQGLNFDNISVPVLLVIKKNTGTLKNVIDWLEQQYKGNRIDHAMLVIDDESDYASINTKEEEDPTAINLKLRKLLSLFDKYAYIAYTATPYANIFIDHQATHGDVGQDLFPRREQFEEVEREALGPLNPLRYEVNKQVMVTVMKNGYIRLGEDIHYYSVPYNYIGKKVKVLYTSIVVKVYYQYTLIASHRRIRIKYRYTTDENHLASQHRYLTEWSPEKFIQQAEAIHDDVARYITKVLEHKVYPEQAYKSCSGILSFARRVGAGRLADACRWADNLGQYNYPVIEEILKKRLDQLQHEEEPVSIPAHNNIRGKEYYK